MQMHGSLLMSYIFCYLIHYSCRLQYIGVTELWSLTLRLRRLFFHIQQTSPSSEGQRRTNHDELQIMMTLYKICHKIIHTIIKIVDIIMDNIILPNLLKTEGLDQIKPSCFNNFWIVKQQESQNVFVYQTASSRKEEPEPHDVTTDTDTSN